MQGVANTSINPLQELARAIAIKGSLYNLSRLSGINRGTLRNIYKNKYTTSISTILRLKNFVERNENRPGRPFKNKQTEGGENYLHDNAKLNYCGYQYYLYCERI